MSSSGGPPEYPPYPAGGADDSSGAGGTPAGQPVCVRHPDRPTGLRCARCDRPACPQCLREASVGSQCVDCVRAGSRGVRTPRSTLGTRVGISADGPLVVPALIVLNTAVFLLTVVQSASLMGNASAPLFRAWSLYPPAVADGQWWRLITTGFLHFGPLHLLFNMWALYVIGRDLELTLGRGRFLAVYLVSLLGGSTSAFLFSDLGASTAGASGAVFGLMGGLVVVLRRLSHSARPALILIAVNLLLSVTIPGISLSGHLGGLVVGAVLTAALVYAPRARQTLWQAGAVGVLVALLAVVMVLRASAVQALLS